jgi:WbqC-like protein
MTVVTAHQPNFLPGASVVSKIAAADVVIWLDEVAYSHGGWTNRNRLPNGDWMTVPVAQGSPGLPINEVRIGTPTRGDWRANIIAGLQKQLQPSRALERVCRHIARPRQMLSVLNLALLDVLLEELAIETPWRMQSQLDGGYVVTAVSESAAELEPISTRLAMMVAEVGGTVYLSGPSGRHYLDEEPFRARGLEVAYWSHEGENPCALQLVPVMEAAA